MDKAPARVYGSARWWYGHAMHRTAPILASLLLVASASASAELLRFEFESQARQFPSTFEEFEVRMRSQSSLTVSWVDPTWYDPNYTVHGGATVGSVAYLRNGAPYNDTVTWIRFDSVEIARAYEVDAAAWSSPYSVTRCDAAVCIQVYASTGQQTEIAEVFAFLGAQ